MDDDIDERDDTKRKSRNLSEKKRRDQFNLLINELSTIVSTNNRKMDKSTVLKSTIAFLKQHNEITVRSRVHEIQEDWKPSFLSNEEFAHLVLEALDGFIMIFSVSGKIFYASESITSLLGHLPSDLLNMTIYDLAYEEDHSEIYNVLVNPINVVMEPLQNVLTTDNQICFSCHLRRGGIDYCDDITYEFVQFIGYFRNDVDIDGLMSNTRSIGFVNESSDTKLLFVGTSRIQTPQLIREMSIVDATKSEFTSRHSLEWKFLFLDHRAPPIIGYLPFEVLGTSGYDYYHFDDLEKVTLCHEDLMQKGEGTSCYYRFLTKGQQWIWLQTRYYITYHQWNSKPEFVVCTHRVISYTDVIKHFRKLHIGDVGEHTMMSGDSNELQFSTNLNDFLGGPENVLAKSTPSSTTSNSRTTTIITSTTIATSTMTPTMSRTWRLKASNLKRFPETRSSSPNLLQPHSKSYANTFQTPESDTMTSISTESLASKHSVMTQYSTQYKVRQPIYLQTTSRIKQPILQEQLLHHGTRQSTDDNQYPQNVQYQTTVNSNPQAHSDHEIVSSSTTSVIPAQILSSTPILEGTPHQYITAASVQPILASNYIGTTPVLTSIHPSSELSHSTRMNSAQSHVQDQLHRKHEELQHIIVQQQEELRRVSEQLIFARYGMIPSSIPYATTTTTTIPLHLNIENPISAINNPDISLMHPHPHQLPSLHTDHIAQHQHNLLQSNDIQQHQQQQQQIIRHQNMQHAGQQTLVQSSNRHRHHHPHRQHQQQENSEDMMSYMELTTPIMEPHHQPRVHQHQPPSNNEMIIESGPNQTTTTATRLNSQHQPTQHANDLEILPYQMPEQQAQILFTSPRSTPK